MSGLVGFTGDLAGNRSEALLWDMARAIKHEDWYKVDLHCDENIALGRVSLGLLNPVPQPVWNEDRTRCIVMEGELYDYQAWKQRLIACGHRFEVNNDAEFMLHLFEEFGEEFVHKLNGAFVAAIWDRQAHKLVLVNDRLGLYPVYYSWRRGILTFSSGVRALLADATLPRHVDPIAMAQFLSFEHVLDDRTLLTEVHLIPPASLLTYEKGRISMQTYWRLEFTEFYRSCSQDEYLEGLLHYLQQAISRQAHDDLAAGVNLSGGLDSRMILALLRHVPRTGPLHTFTFGIPNCDDARLARELAALVGAQHHFFELKPDYLLHAAEEGIRLTDGLMSCVHIQALATLRAETSYAHVIYTGYIGDALMGGHLQRHWWANYDDDTESRLLFEKTRVLFRQTNMEALFTQDFQHQVKDAVFESFRAAVAESKTPLVANRQNHFDLRQRQRRFILNGNELVRSQAIVRTPFCDNDLVEFMLTVPPGLRFDRLLMREALIRLAPDLVKVPYEATGLPLVDCARDLRIRVERMVRWRLHAAGLQWISLPERRPYADYGGWMRTALRGWIERTLLDKQTLERNYVRPEHIRSLVEHHMQGQANYWRELGALMTVELWHRQLLD